MNSNPNNKNSSGFTLIELLISVVLLLILLGPLFSFLRIGQLNRSINLKTTDIEQNARAAMITMGRDITNAGFNFDPNFPLGTINSFNNLIGANNDLTPLIPGNNVNQVKIGGSALVNETDQITLIYVDQSFNNGLPLAGTYDFTAGNTNSRFTVTSDPTNVNQLFTGDLLFLSRGTQSAIASVSNISTSTPPVITFDTTNDISQINKFTATDPLATISIPDQPALPVQPPLLAYRFTFVTFFVDSDGNLIRREKLPPPHTPIGDGGMAIPIPGMVSPDSRVYNCNGTCYYDNIIATGIEDLQFTYNLNGNQPALLPVQDPGFRGANAPISNLGAAPTFRLSDIREVNVEIKVRAADRDFKLRDPNEPTKGYLYRFSLNGTFGVRNIYRTNFTPDLRAINP